jgi:hypothetical protein
MGGILDCGMHRACDNNIKSAVVKKQVLRLLSMVSVFATKTPGFNILKSVFLCRAINLLCGLLYFPFFFSRHLSIGSQHWISATSFTEAFTSDHVEGSWLAEDML